MTKHLHTPRNVSISLYIYNTSHKQVSKLANKCTISIYTAQHNLITLTADTNCASKYPYSEFNLDGDRYLYSEYVCIYISIQ